MPKSPNVSFNFENRNVVYSVPLIGVTNVVARTTRGPFNDPKDLIYSFSQFQRMYGSEVVPDGSVSNIEKALSMGSILRISRVKGTGATFGWAQEKTGSETNLSGETIPEKALLIVLEMSNSAGGKLSAMMGVRTKEAGSAVIDNTGYNLNRNFFFKLVESDGPTYSVSMVQSKSADFAASDILDNRVLISGGSNFINASTLADFINNCPNIELIWQGATSEDPALINVASSITSISSLLSVIQDNANSWSVKVKVAAMGASSTPGAAAEIDDEVYTINEGNAGTFGPTESTIWKDAYEATKQYTEAYQVILSHVHQTLNDDTVTSLYKVIAEDVNANFENMLFVEIPKDNYDNTLTKLKAWVGGTVGKFKSLAYFGGGIKYYNSNGSLKDCDVLGSVIGLADSCASIYGPWYSFAGMNRGVIENAYGPVMENLGSPGNIDKLNSLAQWYMNLFVVKDTRSQGKQTMMWHGFTSNPREDSEKFISVVRLNLYLKKNLRPILESYIEEPNTFETWKKIYLEARDVLDSLVDGKAMTSYTWLGDQDAQSYADMQVNTEAEVRQGKYHCQLIYKEVVPLQEIINDIIIDMAIDKNSGEISISTNY